MSLARSGATRASRSKLAKCLLRFKAAVLPSSGTLNVAPSPTTSKMFAVRILSLRGRSVRGMLTPFGFPPL